MIVLGDLLAVQIVADVSQLTCPPAAEQAAALQLQPPPARAGS